MSAPYAVGDAVELGMFHHHATGVVMETGPGWAEVRYYVPAELSHNGRARVGGTRIIWQEEA